MTSPHDSRGGSFEDLPPGAGPGWGHLPHGQLTNAIIGAMFEVHNVLGSGFLETSTPTRSRSSSGIEACRSNGTSRSR